MKQFFLGAFVILLAINVNAQEYKKQLKNANKTLGKYYLDPVANKALLTEAIATINQAFSADGASLDPEAWTTKGQIYNEIAKAEMIKKIADSSYVLSTPEAALVAKDAFDKAMSMAIKKSQTKDALTGLHESEEYLNNIGITHFQVQKYDDAYKNFAASIKVSDVLKENKEKSRLEDPKIGKDQLFYTGVAAYLGSDKTLAKPYFESLYALGGTQEPLVYEGLFSLYSETDEAKAMKVLEEGRKANPDDNGLVFAEINYYLSKGKLDLLTDKLKAAIVKEPENISVYVTLGNVYDQLNQKERAAGNIAKADEYFTLAFDTFKQALEKNPDNFDATYSQGALYYNKAASMTTKLNELSNDYSSAGTKKYNAIKAEMDGYFQQALPFFIKAEKLDGKDQSTMIALKEIYARSGQLDKSNEYKSKIEGMK